MWQDYAMFLVGIIFSISLFPQIYKIWKFKNAESISRFTSILSFIGLLILAVSQFTLKLYLTSIMTFVTSGCWLVIFGFTLVYKKKSEKGFKGRSNEI